MENALFINGVFEDTLDEIIKSQDGNPDETFYLQPYSQVSIKQLKDNPPRPDNPLPLYISTTSQLNQICYLAEIIGWEDKNRLSDKRQEFLNKHMKRFQPNEGRIYLESSKGKKCANLVSIRNLKRLTNQLSTLNLIKLSDGESLKPRTRSGNWSYVCALPLLSIDGTVIKKSLDEQLARDVSKSLRDDDAARNKRLANAPKIPEKKQTISYDFKRNPDVIATVLKRAHGKCELCGSNAPFLKLSDGVPYLEVHHWTTLADGGEDSVGNAGALCPNCHKRAHFGLERDYIKSNRALAGFAKGR